MGLFGDLLSIPLKIVNAPIKAVENLIDVEPTLSKPLSELSKQIEKVDEKESDEEDE